MPFKTGKQNVVSLQKARIRELEEELVRTRQLPMLQVFAERLGTAMLVQLASQPFDKWPAFAKSTFDYVKRDSPTSAYFYKEALPK